MSEKTWRYSSVGPDGVPITGTMEAKDAAEVQKRLKFMGMGNADFEEIDPDAPPPKAKPALKAESGAAAAARQATEPLTGFVGGAVSPQSPPETFSRIQRSARNMTQKPIDINIDGYAPTSFGRMAQNNSRRQRLFYGQPKEMLPVFEKYLAELNGRVVHAQVCNDSKGLTQIMTVIEYDDTEKERKDEANGDAVPFAGPVLGGVQRGAPQGEQGGEQSDGGLRGQDGERTDDGGPGQEVHQGDEQGVPRTRPEHQGGQEGEPDAKGGRETGGGRPGS